MVPTAPDFSVSKNEDVDRHDIGPCLGKALRAAKGRIRAAWGRWASVVEAAEGGRVIPKWTSPIGPGWCITYKATWPWDRCFATMEYCCSWSKSGVRKTFMNSSNNAVLLERQLQMAYLSGKFKERKMASSFWTKSITHPRKCRNLCNGIMPLEL